MTDASKAAQSMAVMSKLFVGRLPVRYEKLNAALALCRANPAAVDNWVELHRLTQSLAEAAAAFGRDALSEQAGMIDLLLQDMLAQDARSGADVDEVSRLLALLQTST